MARLLYFRLAPPRLEEGANVLYRVALVELGLADDAAASAGQAINSTKRAADSVLNTLSDKVDDLRDDSSGAAKRIAEQIDHGDLSSKPGWVRLSIHPTMTDAEIDFILAAIRETTARAGEWEKDYSYSPSTNEFRCLRASGVLAPDVASWFKLGE